MAPVAGEVAGGPLAPSPAPLAHSGSLVSAPSSSYTPSVRSAAPRMAGWVEPPPGVLAIDWIYCPAGHHFSRKELADILESDALTCQHRAHAGAEPCGLKIIVVFVNRVAVGEDGAPIRKIFVAHVDWRELQYLKTAPEGQDVFRMIAWLGCRYAPAPAARAQRPQRRVRGIR